MVLSILFVDFAYKTFSLRQRDVQTDAIVVLAGGRGRIEEGIRLYREGKGTLLFLIGVSPSVRKIDLFKERPSERRGDHVFLEKVSRNTLENAIYARELILKHKVGSIKLITSRYHMKRATLLFRTMLPKDIAIFPYPVDSKNLKEEWWSDESSFRLLFSEFYKYCMFRLMFLVASGEMLPMAGS
jgi:uncharacterized SAM-binding protein YcdF (DUF218 family)